MTADNIKMTKVDWLIKDWVANNSLNLLAGREGLGKSTIACSIAAQATRGELTGQPMKVAYLATEDDLGMTVAPRLKAAGADMKNMYVMAVTTETGNPSVLRLPSDTSILEKGLVDNGVELIILDSLKSAKDSSIDDYKDDQVRQFLEPLAQMCSRNNMCIIGLVHFGKKESSDSGKLIMGSIAYSQVARSVLSVAQDKAEGDLVITNTKGNLASGTVSRSLTIESTPVEIAPGDYSDIGCVVWGDFTDRNAEDLLRDFGGDEADQEQKQDCKTWLRQYLTTVETCGVRGAYRRDVLSEARKEGMGVEKTVQRAFKKLNGQTKFLKDNPGQAFWYLP